MQAILRTALHAFFTCWLLTFLMPSILSAETTIQQFEQQAVESALQWLALLDEGQIQQCWDQLDGSYKINIDEDKWQTIYRLRHKYVGPALDRKVLNAKVASIGANTTYVIIKIKSKYKTGLDRIEIITPKLGEDGIWKVSGYYSR